MNLLIVGFKSVYGILDLADLRSIWLPSQLFHSLSLMRYLKPYNFVQAVIIIKQKKLFTLYDSL